MNPCQSCTRNKRPQRPQLRPSSTKRTLFFPFKRSHSTHSGRVIAVAIEGDQHIAQLVEHVIYIPQAPELLLPVLEVIPLQLLAYHIAVRTRQKRRRTNNFLAKSVTVE